jgi:hypothetical protein
MLTRLPASSLKQAIAAARATAGRNAPVRPRLCLQQFNRVLTSRVVLAGTVRLDVFRLGFRIPGA